MINIYMINLQKTGGISFFFHPEKSKTKDEASVQINLISSL